MIRLVFTHSTLPRCFAIISIKMKGGKAREYSYDDHFTLVVNASAFPQKEKDIPLDDIEKAFENDKETGCGTCSTLNDAALPQNKMASAKALFYFVILWRNRIPATADYTPSPEADYLENGRLLYEKQHHRQ